MNARDELLQYADRYGYTEHVNALLDAYRAEVLREGLTVDERQFLTFALELAADQMASRGNEFDDADEAALKSLRRMADEAAVR